MKSLKQNPAIKLTPEFKKWLDQQGHKGETYEDIIKRLCFKFKKKECETNDGKNKRFVKQ